MARRITVAVSVCLCCLALYFTARGYSGENSRADDQHRKASIRSHQVRIPLEKAIRVALRSSDTGARGEALDTLLPDLMRRDMQGAADLATSLESWASGEDAMRKVIDTWAESAPEAAAAWAVTLTDDAQRKLALSLICNKAAHANPAAAMELAETHSLTSDADLTENLIQLWASRDASEASAWVERQHDAEIRDHCWARIATAHAAAAPEEAATLAVNRISGGEIQEEAVISVLHQWALRDPEAAASWVNLFPAGALRERAEGELTGTR